MNLMREQHFRRKCARHTISVASPLFGECRTEETPSCRTSGAYREHAGLFRRGVCGGWPAFFRVRSLRMETVAALLLIMLGGCKEERPVAEAPTPLGMQRIAVAASPAEGWCHEDVLDTGCGPDIPPCAGRTLLHRRSPAACPEAARHIGLGPQDSHPLCGSRRHTSIKTGVGPNLVLLHPLRTHLDIFEKIIPGLEQHFTVHAFDYPGHGWSDIPNAAYAPKDFYQWTAAYLDKLDIRRAAIVGISIGGTLSLMLAAPLSSQPWHCPRAHPRLSRVCGCSTCGGLPIY